MGIDSTVSDLQQSSLDSGWSLLLWFKAVSFILTVESEQRQLAVTQAGLWLADRFPDSYSVGYCRSSGRNRLLLFFDNRVCIVDGARCYVFLCELMDSGVCTVIACCYSRWLIEDCAWPKIDCANTNSFFIAFQVCTVMITASFSVEIDSTAPFLLCLDSRVGSKPVDNIVFPKRSGTYYYTSSLLIAFRECILLATARVSVEIDWTDAFLPPSLLFDQRS